MLVCKSNHKVSKFSDLSFTLYLKCLGLLICLDRRGLLVDTSPSFKTAFGRWKGSSRWRFDSSFSRYWAIPGNYSSAKTCCRSVFQLLLSFISAHHERKRCIDCQRFFPCYPLVGGSFWNGIKSRQKRWYDFKLHAYFQISTIPNNDVLFPWKDFCSVAKFYAFSMEATSVLRFRRHGQSNLDKSQYTFS